MSSLAVVRSFIQEHSLFAPGDRVVVALSGGPDSLCLLGLLKKMTAELEIELVVAHLNHCLRPEADQEEAAVINLCAEWSLPVETKATDVRRLKQRLGLSEEAAGRLARYSFLVETARKHRAASIALGHHLDDQAETVLLNLIRGSGVDGLSGMRPKSTRGGVCLVRPLLCLWRRDIEQYCRDQGLSPCTDSSNLETGYTRNRIRLELIPRLEKDYNPGVKSALVTLAVLAALDRSFLQGLARRSFLKLVRFRGEATLIPCSDLLALAPSLQGRVLRLALQKYTGARKISFSHIRQLLALTKSSGEGGPVDLPGSVKGYRVCDRLILTRRSLRKGQVFKESFLQVPGRTALPGGRSISARLAGPGELYWPPPASKAYLDFDLLPAGKVVICPRWPGARFYPQGASGSKKLKDFLIDQKVPRRLRDDLPLVTVGEEILWVAGLRVAHPYRVTANTARILVLDFKSRRGKKFLNREAQ